MSGGRWEYCGEDIAEKLLGVAQDSTANDRWPLVCTLLARLAPVIQEIEHDMDWCLSGDRELYDKDFEVECYKKLRKVVLLERE